MIGVRERLGGELKRNPLLLELGPSAGRSLATFDAVLPVSYTHLDVYKRQRYALVYREG